MNLEFGCTGDRILLRQRRRGGRPPGRDGLRSRPGPRRRRRARPEHPVQPRPGVDRSGGGERRRGSTPCGWTWWPPREQASATRARCLPGPSGCGRPTGCACIWSTSPEGRLGCWPSRSSLVTRTTRSKYRSRTSSRWWRRQRPSSTPSSSSTLIANRSAEGKGMKRPQGRSSLASWGSRSQGARRPPAARRRRPQSSHPCRVLHRPRRASDRSLSRPRPSQTLSDDPVPEDVAAKFQAALADMAGGGGIAATVMTRRWDVERGLRARRTASTTCSPTASSASPAARSRSSPPR